MKIDWNIVDDDVRPDAVEPSDALDARRIHGIVLERREAHRARLRAVFVPIACVAVCATALGQAGSMRASHPAWAAICAAIAVVAAWAGIRAARRRPAIADASIDEPARPDFAAMPAPRTTAERLAELK